MKLHVLLALAGLTTGLTLPALAQQEEPPLGEQDYQKLVELGKKNDEAWSKRDATALAALYTKDALFVTPRVYCRAKTQSSSVTRTVSRTSK